MKKKYLIAIAVIVVIVTIGLVGCTTVVSTPSDTSQSVTETTVTTYENVTQEQLEEDLTKYREIAASLATQVDALKATVAESIVAANTNIGGYAAVYVDSVLNITCSEPNKSSVSGCQGTGFIISEDGYVLTNNHVVSYETEEINYDDFRGYNWIGQKVYGTKTTHNTYSSVKASFDQASAYPSNSVFTLQVLYRDPAYDLALCKITESVPVGDHWTAIPFYDGTIVRGNELLVLGNARGFGYSATTGIVSATGKTFNDSPQLTFIQTDAAINGGNSGGPAINIYGGLVGVVNSKFVSVIKSSYFTSEIEDVEGMGFAIELTKVNEFLVAAQASAGVTVTTKTVSSTSTAA